MERTDFEHWKGKEVARLLALIETERRYYQEMVAALPVAIAVLSTDRSIVLANRAFGQMFGLRADEIRRKTIEQLLPSDQLIEKIRAAHVETGAQGARRAGLVLESAGRLLRVDVRPIRNWDEDAEMETLVAIYDLSNVDRSEVGTARTTVIAVPTAAPTAPEFPSGELPAIVWQADAETFRFTAVSGAAGFGSQWLQAGGFERRIHADDREATMALYRSVAERGGEASAEFRLVTSSGEAQWCRETVVAAAPRGGNGKIHGSSTGVLTGVLTFVGERKRMERQIEIAARHAALSGLSARLAHDLNNPLMLIAGYAEEMLHAFPEGDARREDVKQIVTATERIAEVTAHLLRFTRRGTTRPRSVDVATVLRRLEPRLASVFAESVAVRIEAGERVWAFADSRPLEEVLVALAGTARDSAACTQIGIACVWVAVREQVPGATLVPGAYVRVTVSGNGPGFDADKSASLFESILPRGADQANSGAVAHAYGLVREWGGDIAYTGDAFHSTFVVYLRPAEPREAEPEEPTAAEPEAPRQLVLVVDDEPGIRALVAKILRREGYAVIEAGSATEAAALAAAQERPVELLVTDVMLPDRHGPELAGQLLEMLPELKVLYISGYTEDESVRAGEYPPGAKFLQKPFTLGALVAKVRESLEQA
ncbi:MAG TPA: response regulator [Bryobacteraceae bacterium]|nr:response regulator [Bryobacteraceae bacterium]